MEKIIKILCTILSLLSLIVPLKANDNLDCVQKPKDRTLSKYVSLNTQAQIEKMLSKEGVSNTAKITYQSEPVITIWDISGYGQPYDLQYDRDIGWKNPSCAWVSFYPLGAIMGEKCWLRGYVNGYGHWIDYEY